MNDKKENKLPFRWSWKPHGTGYVDVYDHLGMKVVCLPDSVDLESFVFSRIQETTGLSRDALEMAIWCSENIDTKQPRLLFNDGDLRIVRISSGESSLIFSEDGDIADTFLGDFEDNEGPVNAGVFSATVAVAAINEPRFRARVRSELDELQAELQGQD